jgi:hypothetical protein
MGQLWSNQSGSIKAYWLPPGIPEDPISQNIALAVAKGERTPMGIVSSASSSLAINLVGGLVILLIILIVRYIWYRPEHPFIYTAKKESFSPRDEARESWVRV